MGKKAVGVEGGGGTFKNIGVIPCGGSGVGVGVNREALGMG